MSVLSRDRCSSANEIESNRSLRFHAAKSPKCRITLLRCAANTWLALLVLLFLTASANRATAANVADFSDFSLVSNGSVVLPGRLYIPPVAITDPNTRRPFIVFLHGSGENGTNNLSQINVNIDNLLAEAKRRGAYLYAPQTNNYWFSQTVTDQVMTMIDRAVSERNVDNSRLYVTGLSAGGGGTWNMINWYPDRFAAGVPICGVYPESDFVPSRLIDQAMFVFHARDDALVPVGISRDVINSILTAAGKPLPTYPPLGSSSFFSFAASGLDLTYIEYATGGHGIWTQAYNTPGMYNWLFSHTTAVPEPGLASALTTIAYFAASSRRPRRHSTI